MGVSKSGGTKQQKMIKCKDLQCHGSYHDDFTLLSLKKLFDRVFHHLFGVIMIYIKWKSILTKVVVSKMFMFIPT